MFDNLGLSTDNFFSLMSVSSPDMTFDLYTPQLTAPLHLSQFNHGTVAIEWTINDPPALDGSLSDSIVYDIEYTDNYQGVSTNWYAITKRVPYESVSYSWVVGKMVKSNTVRVRIRARCLDSQKTSEWSISDEFSVNVFDLISPAIVSPSSGYAYSDFILIILDDSLSINTYNQKVRYTIDYSSQKQGIDWTTIRENIPFGQNAIRWNIESLLPSDDYVLRLTAKNQSTSCIAATEATPDQISRTFVHGIIIQQSGMFLIDTKPPQAILEINNNTGVTSQLEQTINIFAEDATTEVATIQMRECDASSMLALGDLEDPYDPLGGCESLSSIISDISKFGKPVGNSPKLQWILQDKSGLRKIEALLTDAGGNTSLQDVSKVFLPVLGSVSRITDFIVVIEQRDKIEIDDSQSPPVISLSPSTFEVVYAGNELGELWILDPFAKLLYTVPDSDLISKLIEFSDIVYFFTYNQQTGVGKAYRHDGASPTEIFEFSSALSLAKCVSIYESKLYIGMQNGQLWEFNGSTCILVNTFESPVVSLAADREYLFIGFENSNAISAYNGIEFNTLAF